MNEESIFGRKILITGTFALGIYLFSNICTFIGGKRYNDYGLNERQTDLIIKENRTYQSMLFFGDCLTPPNDTHSMIINPSEYLIDEFGDKYLPSKNKNSLGDKVENFFWFLGSDGKKLAFRD